MRFIVALVLALGLAAQAAAGKELVLGVRSATFKNNAFLPSRTAYPDCGGGNVSPALHWSGFTAAAKSFAITVWDPDAPAPGGWWHWGAYDIPSSVRSVSEGRPVGRQTLNSFGEPGWGGPCPPPGKAHHYHIVVYALDVAHLPGLRASSTTRQLVAALRPHIVGAGSITGLFKQ